MVTRYADDGSTVVATTDYGYDGIGRLKSLTHQDGASPTPNTLADYSWTYDAAGWITGMTSPDGDTTFTLDNTDQLTDANYVGDWQTDETYEYDDNGNRINTGYGTGTGNRLLSDGTYGYQYDAEGNRIAKTIGGNTLHLSGDGFARIILSPSYPVDQDTVLEFDFRSSAEGDIHAIALSPMALPFLTKFVFQLYGTPDERCTLDYADYDPSAGWKHYQIPVGQYYEQWGETRDAFSLLFLNYDFAAEPVGESLFRNVQFYQAGSPPPEPIDFSQVPVELAKGSVLRS